MEAVQDNVEALWNEYIKFPITEVEMQVYIHTFQDVADLLHIVGQIVGSHIRVPALPDSAVDYISVDISNKTSRVQAVINGRKLFLDFQAVFMILLSSTKQHNMSYCENWGQ